MRVRGAALLSTQQQEMLTRLTPKQVAALLFCVRC